MWISGIGKLITGRYLWMMILAASSAAIIGIWAHGYATGKKNQQIQIIEKIVEVEAKSKRASNETTKRIKTLDEITLDSELCHTIGIVRGNNGCK